MFSSSLSNTPYRGDRVLRHIESSCRPLCNRNRRPSNGEDVTSNRGKVILVIEKNRVYTLSILSGRGL